jgi:hypothetical protein
MSSADPRLHSHDAAVTPDAPVVTAPDDFDPALEARAVALVQEFFPGPVEIEEDFNPSEPEHKWRVIVVESTRPLDQISAAKALWRQRVIREFTPDESLRYTLVVVPKAP